MSEVGRGTGWAVKLIAPSGEASCFVSKMAQQGFPLGTETAAECIALWETREAALAFCEAQGLPLGPGSPFGAGWERVAVVLVDVRALHPRPWWLCGTLSLIPSVSLPNAEPSERRRVQSLFAFGGD